MIERFDQLCSIWEHYGQERQLAKLMEEAYEVTDAVRECNLDHMEEEIADVMVVLYQVIYMHGLNLNTINRMMAFKVERTLERMKDE